MDKAERERLRRLCADAMKVTKTSWTFDGRDLFGTIMPALLDYIDALETEIETDNRNIVDAMNQLAEAGKRIEALEQQREGWKLVPVEPTDEMLKQASCAINSQWTGRDDIKVYWRTMIAAAPEPQRIEESPYSDMHAIEDVLVRYHKAMSPRFWGDPENKAWHQNIPDIQAAFDALHDLVLSPKTPERPS